MIQFLKLISNYNAKLNEQVSKMKNKEAFVTAYQLYSICNIGLNYLVVTNTCPSYDSCLHIIGKGKEYTSILRAYLEQESKSGVTNIASGTNLIIEEIINRIYGASQVEFGSDHVIFDLANFSNYCSVISCDDSDNYAGVNVTYYPNRIPKIPVVSLISRFVSTDSSSLVPLTKFRLYTTTKSRLNSFSLKKSEIKKEVLYNGATVDFKYISPYIELIRLFNGTDERSFFTLISMYSDKIHDSLKGLIQE